ncbi:MAG: serine hydrolase [Gammaproteobacteria bacterium]|nr:serine hydrolase [Gammaproteobacteria bacterium]
MPVRRIILGLTHRIGCLIWSFVFSSSIPTLADEKVQMDVSELESLKPVMQGWIDSKMLPNAAVLVLQHGENVFEHHVGMLDLELGTPVQPNSLYRIYSMTKPIAAVAAMMLVEQGKLSLDEPIAKVLPEFSDLKVLENGVHTPAKPMTLRHLLSHSSGLTYGYYGDTEVDRLYRQAGLIDDWDYLVPTTHDLVVGLGSLPLLFHPGERFHYSFASDVVSEIVARVSGMRFDHFLTQALWQPLGIEDAYFDVPENELTRFGTNQYPARNDVFPIQDTPRVDPEFRDVTFLSGGGGLVMSIHDFGKFAQSILDGLSGRGHAPLRKPTLLKMLTNQLETGTNEFQYGLGFGIRRRPDPFDAALTIDTYYWGGAAGTSFWIDPEYELAVVFFTQLIGAPNEPVSVLSRTVYASLEQRQR